MEYTHYHPETKTLLEVGVCENCGNRVQEPNACGYSDSTDLWRLISLFGSSNLRKLEGSLPPETFHCDELESSACYGCR
jgi:hypothetical protein